MKFPVNFLRFSQVGATGRYKGLSRFRRIIGLFALIAVAAAFQACSAVKLAYNNAPDLAYWYLDSYVDFNGAQSVQIKQELAGLQTWHRQTQLPAYIDSLQRISQKLTADLNAAQACEVFSDVRSKMVAITLQAEPTVAALAATLSPEQLTQMERKFEKGNAKFREDFLAAKPGASRKKRYKEAVSRAEMLYGRLDDKQLEKIDRAIDQSGFNASLAYEERLRRQSDMLQSLRAVAGVATTPELSGVKAREGMRTMFDRWRDSPNVVYRNYFEQLTESSCISFAQLHNSTTMQQRAKAVEVIGGYVENIRALASKYRAG